MTETFDPLEKLTLLEAHAIDLRPTPSAFQKLTPEDIAAKLAKVSRGASLLGRVKVLEQRHLWQDLVSWLKVEIMGEIMKPGQKDHAMFDLMTRLAIQEVVDPRTCRTCKGVGHFMIDAKPMSCEDCAGGRYAWSDYSRSQACGVHHEVWKRKHARIYVEILTIPWTWEGELRQALRS